MPATIDGAFGLTVIDCNVGVGGGVVTATRTAFEVLLLKFALPPKTAVTLFDPTGSCMVAKLATPDEFSVPVPSVAIPFIKDTLPVGVVVPEAGVTVAVKVMLVPVRAEVVEDVNAVLVAIGEGVGVGLGEGEGEVEVEPPPPQEIIMLRRTATVESKQTRALRVISPILHPVCHSALLCRIRKIIPPVNNRPS